jgi:hypothetical protein
VKRILTKSAVAIVFVLLFAGWGAVGHKIISQNIYKSFPSAMHFPNTWSTFLTFHASDPDNRKNSDTTESPRHFIDIDAYPEFVAHGFISQSYDTNVTLHGSSWIITQGVLPWAIVLWEDSLRRAFQQGNWSMAMQLSADLGHYVGDGHQPLHITSNYDGKDTHQRGVHSRYETDLVGRYQSSIYYSNDSASYVSDISNYVFDFIYTDYKYVDSVLYGDSVATAFADTDAGVVYLQKYWDICGNQTFLLMKNASKSAADLIYTAWVDAGSPDPNTTSVNDKPISPASFNLYQNYPNPFNPATSIKFSIAEKGNVTLKVFDVVGRKVAELVNGEKEPGNYEITFDASKLSSGVYFFQLSSAGSFQSKKMILMK